jgi:hypothetical protein
VRQVEIGCKSCFGVNPAFFSGWRPRKKSGFAEDEIFLEFETDPDFSNQKSGCRLKGRLRAYCPSIYTVSPPPSEQQLNQLFNCLHL